MICLKTFPPIRVCPCGEDRGQTRIGREFSRHPGLPDNLSYSGEPGPAKPIRLSPLCAQQWTLQIAQTLSCNPRSVRVAGLEKGTFNFSLPRMTVTEHANLLTPNNETPDMNEGKVESPLFSVCIIQKGLDTALSKGSPA